MSARLGMQDDVIRRDHATGRGAHDHWIYAEQARRLQADAIAKCVRWAWTNARQIVARLIKGREPMPTASGKPIPTISGRATVGDAFRRDLLRLVRLVRRSILEPHARRRRIAIAQLRALDDHLLADIGLTRGQIETAVDGMLGRRGDGFVRPIGRTLPAEDPRHELPLAA